MQGKEEMVLGFARPKLQAQMRSHSFLEFSNTPDDRTKLLHPKQTSALSAQSKRDRLTIKTVATRAAIA